MKLLRCVVCINEKNISAEIFDSFLFTRFHRISMSSFTVYRVIFWTISFVLIFFISLIDFLFHSWNQSENKQLSRNVLDIRTLTYSLWNHWHVVTFAFNPSENKQGQNCFSYQNTDPMEFFSASWIILCLYEAFKLCFLYE